MIDPRFARSGWLLAAGLRDGEFTIDDAIAWADGWATRLDQLPDGLWDVSMPSLRRRSTTAS